VLLVDLAAGLLEDRCDKAVLVHSKWELVVQDIVQRLRKTGKLKSRVLRDKANAHRFPSDASQQSRQGRR